MPLCWLRSKILKSSLIAHRERDKWRWGVTLRLFSSRQQAPTMLEHCAAVLRCLT